MEFYMDKEQAKQNLIKLVDRFRAEVEMI